MHKVVHLKFPRRHDRIRKNFFHRPPGLLRRRPSPYSPEPTGALLQCITRLYAPTFFTPPLLFSAQKLAAPKERESISSSSSSFLLAFTSSDGPRFSKRRRGKRRRKSAKNQLSAGKMDGKYIRRSFLNLLLSARRKEIAPFLQRWRNCR